VKLSKVVMENFRSFHGVNTVLLSEDDIKRVTVIHAENGGGKTNFLNAIYWCVTGRFTPRFNQPTVLINKTALTEGIRQCAVELTLKAPEEQQEVEYTIRRTAANGRDNTLAVFRIEAGNAKPIARPDAFLTALFPPGLVDWFFFDAEAIGSLSLSGGDEFKRDIRKVLGFELVDDFLLDLSKVIVKLQREIGALSRNARIEELADNLSNVQHLIPILEHDLRGKRQTLSERKTRIDAIRVQLASLPQSKDLERRRVATEQRKQRLSSEKNRIIEEYSQLLGRSAPAAVLLPLVDQLDGKLQDEEVKGRLPAPYSDQLVKDILDSARCVCGRPVEPESTEFSCITDLLKSATTTEINSKLSDIRYLIRTIERVSDEYPDLNRAALSRRASIETQLADCESELRDISLELGKINQDEVSRLEGEKRKLDSEISQIERSIGAKEQELEEARRSQSALRSEIDNATRAQTVSKSLSKALERAKSIQSFVVEKLRRQEAQSLTIFQIELNAVLQRTFTKGYRAAIDARDYRIDLFDSKNQRVPDSTGEGQVLKFSFVSTMVALAAKKTKAKVDWMVPPTIAPLVLDAPFSALDKTYQGEVAKNLSIQTTQLILMISSAHWDAAVEKNLRESTGKRYLFVSNDIGARGDKPLKVITISNRDYPMNIYDADVDGSSIEELPL
jgi:DNA sulfur modification protein DndD